MRNSTQYNCNIGDSNSADANNRDQLYEYIKDGQNFQLDSEEKITSQYYFVRAKNFEFNYSTNASFQDEKGNVAFTSMINNPRVYITTVGLYNDNNDLIAVAKLSQPVAKDPTKEMLARVNLTF